MSDLITALRERISLLEDEKEELEDSLGRVDSKLETCRELLSEEEGEDSITVATPETKSKKRGRPSGSKNKKAEKSTSKKSKAEDDALWEQAKGKMPDGSKGTTAEEQERAIRRFSPTPRSKENYGVRAGTMEEVMGDQSSKKSDAKVSIKD